MKYTSKSIGNGIEFITIPQEKFKTNTLCVSFAVPAARESNSAYSLALSLLGYSTKAYNTNPKIQYALDNLYGGSLSTSITRRGDALELSIRSSVICDAYTEENLLDPMVDLLLGCIFEPNVEGKVFCDFALQKKALLDSLEAEINEKRSYATNECFKTAFAGEAFALHHAEKEIVEALTTEEVYEAYCTMLRIAEIRVYYVGKEHSDSLAEKFQLAFAHIEREPIPAVYRSISPCKSEVCMVVNPMDVVQSKLVMVLKSTSKNTFAVNLMNVLFGSTPFAMLFMNVREKLSLCYYCSSRFVASKNAIAVSSGVEKQNIEKTREAILAQLESLKNGDFSDELFENGKRYIISELRGIGDTPYSCISCIHQRITSVKKRSIEERIACYQAITREDIIEAARSFALDTVYILEQR